MARTRRCRCAVRSPTSRSEAIASRLARPARGFVTLPPLALPSRTAGFPMRPTQSGFTLVELLMVVALLCLLTACLTPNVVRAQDAANALADNANLRRHYD